MKAIYTGLVLMFFIQTSQAQTDSTLTVIDSMPKSFTTRDSVIISTNSTTNTIQSNSEKTEPNGQVYRIKKGIDIPLTVATTAYTLWGFSKIYGRDKTPESVILALDPNDVNSLDRRVTKYHSQTAKDASDKFFYGSMPLPLLFLFDKK